MGKLLLNWLKIFVVQCNLYKWGVWNGQNLNYFPFPVIILNWLNTTYGHIIQYIQITHTLMYVLVNTCIF